MTATEEKDLFRMVKEIYHHLGLDGNKIISMKTMSEQAQKDVLKWREKQSIKGYERAATP